LSLLYLPFRYRAEVLRGRRYSVPVTVDLRDYAPVLVEEVDPLDMIPAIRCWTGSVRDPDLYLAHRGRLFREVLDPVTGESVTGKTFQDRLSERHDAPPAFPDEQLGAPGSIRRQFPRPGICWTADGPHPLDAPSLEVAKVTGGWKEGWSFQETRADAANAAAQRFLAEAVVSVNGALHVACPEPVWSVEVDRAEPVGVVLERMPLAARAPWLFRLDRLDNAFAWSGLNVRDHPVPEVEILSPAALTRDDDWAMARSVHCWWPLKDVWVPFDAEAVKSLDALIATAKAKGKPFAREDAAAVLDAAERFAALWSTLPNPRREPTMGEAAMTAIGERRSLDSFEPEDRAALLGA